jgi:hypothetical protein
LLLFNSRSSDSITINFSSVSIPFRLSTSDATSIRVGWSAPTLVECHVTEYKMVYRPVEGKSQAISVPADVTEGLIAAVPHNINYVVYVQVGFFFSTYFFI